MVVILAVTLGRLSAEDNARARRHEPDPDQSSCRSSVNRAFRRSAPARISGDGPAQNTPVVLLDEPTTYLDINHQVDLMRLMGELRLRGKRWSLCCTTLIRLAVLRSTGGNGKRTCYGARHTRRGDDPRIAENSIQRGSGNTPRAGIWQADVPNEVDCTGRKNQTTTE